MNRVFIITFAVALGLQTMAAHADDKTCSCVAFTTDSLVAGKITDTKGSVYVAEKNGLVPARSGMEVAVGAYMTVDHNSSARIESGSNCVLEIGENSAVTVLQEDDNQICFQISELQDGSEKTRVTELKSKSDVNLLAFGSSGGFLQGPLPLLIIGGIGITAVASDGGMPRPASR